MVTTDPSATTSIPVTGAAEVETAVVQVEPTVPSPKVVAKLVIKAGVVIGVALTALESVDSPAEP